MIYSVLLMCFFAIFTTSSSSKKKSSELEINEEINFGTSFERTVRNKRDSTDCKRFPNVQCDAGAKYRTADGTCNNLRKPQWGSANSCQQRMMPAYYVGTSGYRQSVEGGPLPPTRLLSLYLHFSRDRPMSEKTHLFMFMGQLIAHDIVHTPVSKTGDDQAIKCCPPKMMDNEACKPISVPKRDPFFKMFNVTCMDFVRSKSCDACTGGSKQIIDGSTSFIDASFVYGNSDDETKSLRKNDGTGRLLVQKSDYGDLLPASLNPQNDSCSFSEKNELCFRAGDDRVNQHLTLTSLQTIFMREHNRIAQEMAKINPEWDDEKLFQEARRIVGAEMQSITYKEFLPILLGDDTMSLYQLDLTDHRTAYNSAVNPAIFVEFSTGAYRLHSLVNMQVTDRPLPVTEGYLRMRDLYSRPFGLYHGSIGPLMEGVTSKPPQQFDRFVVPDVTNFALRRPGKEYGTDLAATHITRGRDHGLPPYVDVLRYCSQAQADVRSFNDLVRLKLMETQDVQSLQKIYKNVQDVDFWPAMNMEIPNGNSVVGPTASCVIARQFYNLKYGDRFYMEHGGQSGSFTNEQLGEIRKTRLSSVICANTDAARLPLNSMLSAGESNPLVGCSDVSTVDLTFWKD